MKMMHGGGDPGNLGAKKPCMRHMRHNSKIRHKSDSIQIANINQAQASPNELDSGAQIPSQMAESLAMGLSQTIAEACRAKATTVWN